MLSLGSRKWNSVAFAEALLTPHSRPATQELRRRRPEGCGWRSSANLGPVCEEEHGARPSSLERPLGLEQVGAWAPVNPWTPPEVHESRW